MAKEQLLMDALGWISDFSARHYQDYFNARRTLRMIADKAEEAMQEDEYCGAVPDYCEGPYGACLAPPAGWYVRDFNGDCRDERYDTSEEAWEAIAKSKEDE